MTDAAVRLPEMPDRFIYDLEPGVLVETDKPIDAEQLAKARDDYADGKGHDKVAKALRGRIHRPEASPVVRVGVDQEELDRLLERAYPDESERTKIKEQLRG